MRCEAISQSPLPPHDPQRRRAAQAVAREVADAAPQAARLGRGLRPGVDERFLDRRRGQDRQAPPWLAEYHLRRQHATRRAEKVRTVGDEMEYPQTDHG